MVFWFVLIFYWWAIISTKLAIKFQLLTYTRVTDATCILFVIRLSLISNSKRICVDSQKVHNWFLSDFCLDFYYISIICLLLIDYWRLIMQLKANDVSRCLQLYWDYQITWQAVSPIPEMPLSIRLNIYELMEWCEGIYFFFFI